MNMNLLQHEKEVIALDADDHLLRPILIRLTVSELRLLQVQVDCARKRRLLVFCAA
jgi:hypothetical protein